ncbi:hypothetical protein J3E73DRAFT_324305 [Bipolaris maydis]|nr:hypothetical protein J3E73DRAFT_324305 [Bipolaris maydis]
MCFTHKHNLKMGFLLPLAFLVHGLQAVDLMALRGWRTCSRVYRVLVSFLYYGFR